MRILRKGNSRFEPLNLFVEVGRVTPCAPSVRMSKPGAHGVTRPTWRFMRRRFVFPGSSPLTPTLSPLGRGEGVEDSVEMHPLQRIH